MATTESLESVYRSLHKVLSRYTPPFKAGKGMVRDKKDLHLLVPKPVTVPGAYGGSPKEVGLASIILQKNYVGFYFMPSYLDPQLRKKLSPALMKMLKGKSCFYIKKASPDLLDDIKAALDLGVKDFRQRGWI